MTQTQRDASTLAGTIGTGSTVKPIRQRKKAAVKTTTEAPPKETVQVQAAPQPEPKTPQASAPVNAEPSRPAAKVSLKDLLRKKATTTSTIIGAINEADEAVKDEGVLQTFLDTIDGGLVLAQHREPDRGSDLVREWNKLGFDQVMEKLQTWANENDGAAAGILDVLKTFKGEETPGTVKVDILTPLWERVVMVRELRNISNYAALSSWLHRMHHIGDVRCFSGQRVEETAVVLLGKDGRSAVQYIPTGRKTKAVWKWVKEAEERAKAHAETQQGRIETLKQMATGITPDAAKAGKAGKVFIQLPGVNRCALLDVHTNGRGMEVRFVTGVGINIRNAGSINPVEDPDKWPDRELFHGFGRWLDGK